ncbi:PREDICTED: deoxyribonuclease-1-like [Gekko japonicus]|uniref:Deoxyribonuclease-1-like n=1 Tax=Gekko japonicus TaxID=146911 RepID=A0ABM1JHW8_GEKJA|nr:PREDICTED: deoxyribonuclease-1-like [Gekko japonicus]
MGRAFAFLLILLGAQLAASTFKICAFNIRSFGKAKAANRKVMGALVQILSRCDISAVQEVRDAKGSAIRILLQELNRYDPSHHYSCLESKRLGRGSYKEQNVFVYRMDVVSVTDWCQFGEEDSGPFEAFARGPFAARFHSPNTGVTQFPTTTGTREIALPEPPVSISLGDRGSVGKEAVIRDFMPLSHPIRVPRIIVHGDELLGAVVARSAKPFNFTHALGLSEEEALEISDHYPVEVNLKLAPKAQREL